MKKMFFIFMMVFAAFFISCGSDDGGSSGNEPVGPGEETKVEVSVTWNEDYKTGSTVTISDNNSTISVKNDISHPLKANDLLGVFYEKDGQLVCGGYIVWTNSDGNAIKVWGDDLTTSDVVEGFTVGQDYQWVIKSIDDGKSYKASATYSSGNAFYTVNGTDIVSSLAYVEE